MRTYLLTCLALGLLSAPAMADNPEASRAATAAAISPDATAPAAPVAANDTTGRPEPQERHRLASAITDVTMIEGETEGAVYLASLDPDFRAKLMKEGQVLMSEDQTTEDSYAGYIRAVAIFHTSKERAYELITEPSMQPEYLPRLVEAESMHPTVVGEVTRFHLRVMFNNIHFNVRHWYYPELSRIEWYLDKDYENDIKDQEGYWQLFAVNDELTVAEYGTRVDTGIAVPRRVQDFFARRDIPSALEAFRAYLDSNGEYRR